MSDSSRDENILQNQHKMLRQIGLAFSVIIYGGPENIPYARFKPETSFEPSSFNFGGYNFDDKERV